MANDSDADRPAQDAATVAARYDREAPAPPDGLEVPDGFVYIHFKAFVYLAQGPEEYRREDFFNLPPADWSAARLALLARGCEQIVNWRGSTPELPLVGLGIDGFYDLLTLFHFKPVSQSATMAEDGGFLDEMVMVHCMMGQELTIYNLVATDPS